MDGKQRCPGTTLGLGMMAALLLGGMAIPRASALGAVQNRIIGPIRSDQMQAIKGTVHPLVAVAQDQGQLNASTPIQGMSLVFRLSPAQQADLTNLLQQQQTKGSPMYHQWLQPGQFAARYGVSQQDLTKAAAWLRSQGFTVMDIPASADRIKFSGTAAQVNATFQTQMHRYLFHGRQNWANSTDISLPQAIAGMAVGVEHLNTFRPEPHVMKRLVHVAPHSGAVGVGPALHAVMINQRVIPPVDSLILLLLPIPRRFMTSRVYTTTISREPARPWQLSGRPTSCSMRVTLPISAA